MCASFVIKSGSISGNCDGEVVPEVSDLHREGLCKNDRDSKRSRGKCRGCKGEKGRQ